MLVFELKRTLVSSEFYFNGLLMFSFGRSVFNLKKVVKVR